MKLSTLALAALLLAAGTAFAEEDGPQMELRIFDVSAITLPHSGRTAPRLGPANRLNYGDPYDNVEIEPEAFFEGEALVELLRETVGIEAWDTGGEISFRGSGMLIVRNLPAVNRKIAEVLAEIEKAATRHVLLSVDVYELDPDRLAAVRAGADPATLGGKLLDSGSVQAQPGMRSVVKVTNRVRYVADYDVEIAQGSNIADPVVASAEEGLAVELEASPTVAGDRVLVTAVVQSGRFARPFRTVELGTDEEYLPEKFRSDRRFVNGRLELPVYEEANAFVTKLVRSGGAFWVPVQAGRRFLAVRIGARLSGEGGLPGMLDVGALSRPGRNVWFGFPAECEESEKPLFAPVLSFHGESVLGCFGSPEELMDLTTQNVDRESWESEGQLIHVSGPSRILVMARTDLVEAVRAFLAARENEALKEIGLDVAVWSVLAPIPSGEEQAEADLGKADLRYATSLTTLPGRRTGALAGSRAAYVADYDVEVAQESRIADPRIAQVFDGFVANLRPVLSVDRSRVTVDLEMLLARRGPIGKFDSGTQFLGPIDRFDVARTVLSQTVEFGANGSYWIDAGPDPDAAGRRLAVRITSKVK